MMNRGVQSQIGPAASRSRPAADSDPAHAGDSSARPEAPRGPSPLDGVAPRPPASASPGRPRAPSAGCAARLPATGGGGGGTSPRIKSAVCIPLGSDGDGALATAEPPDLLRDQPLHLLLVFGGGLAQGLLGLQLGGVQRLSQSLFLPLGLGQQILAV